MPRFRIVGALLLAALAAGCSGGRDARPSRPEDLARIPSLLAAADSASARGATAEARDAYARASQAAKRAGSRDQELRAELGSGLASLTLGDAESARRSLTRAVEIDPRSPAAHIALGRFHTAIRRYRDAKVAFDRAAELDTLSAEPYYRLGLAYTEAGQPKLAQEAFDRALARDPNHAPTLGALGALQDSRYVAAGLPTGYPALRGHPSISRGELGVLLSAELGQNPERPSWRGGREFPSDTHEARGAWGERWVRVAMARGWLRSFPDGSYHLGDPVTRGTLALLLAEIDTSAVEPSHEIDVFPDLGRRHYLFRAARSATAMGLPLRTEGRFEPSASATGAEALAAVRGLARRLGVPPIIPEEPSRGDMVK